MYTNRITLQDFKYFYKCKCDVNVKRDCLVQNKSRF